MAYTCITLDNKTRTFTKRFTLMSFINIQPNKIKELIINDGEELVVRTIVGCENLESLSVTTKSIDGLSMLSCLTKLHTLSLAGYKGILSIDSLDKVMVDNLTLTKCSIKKCNIPISVKHLELSCNKLEDDVDLDYLVNLTSLDITLQTITNLSVLPRLTSLSVADIDLSLISLPNLTSLRIKLPYGENSLATIKHLTKLETLVLVDTGITDIRDITCLTKLTKFHVSFSDLKTIKHLSKCTNLRDLSLYACLFEDSSVFSELSNLETLTLSVCKIRSLNIKAESNIKQICSDMNYITEIKSLPKSLESLEILNNFCVMTPFDRDVMCPHLEHYVYKGFS